MGGTVIPTAASSTAAHHAPGGPVAVFDEIRACEPASPAHRITPQTLPMILAPLLAVAGTFRGQQPIHPKIC